MAIPELINNGQGNLVVFGFYNLILMLVKTARRVKGCIKLSIVSFSLFLLVAFLFLKASQTDSRVREIGLLGRLQSSNEKYIQLRKLDLPFNLAKFDLVAIMSKSYPNIIGDDAILIISASQQLTRRSYYRFLQNIQKAHSEENKVPTYVLKNRDPLMMPSRKYIESYLKEFELIFSYFSTILRIKKLSILAFEESALLTFRTLAESSSTLFQRIHKVVFINLYNPKIKIYDNEPSEFIEQTKALIVANRTRLMEFNQLRMIIIRTIETPYPYKSHADSGVKESFVLTFGGLHLKNTVQVSSRIMWNVYSQLQPHEYFHFEAFIWMLAKLFVDDRHHSLSEKDLVYLLLYRESRRTRYLSHGNQTGLIPYCQHLYLPTSKQNRKELKAECIRVSLKATNSLKNDSLVIYSNHPFELYGQNFQRIYPFDTKLNITVYLVENILGVEKLYIIGSKRHAVNVKVTSVYEPRRNPIPRYKKDVFLFRQNLNSLDLTPVNICPGHRLLFPLHFRRFGSAEGSFFQIQTEQQSCYVDPVQFELGLFNFFRNWGFERNMIMFTMFCSHVTRSSSISRFYLQLLVNQVLSIGIFGNHLEVLFQNVIVLSVVILIEWLLSLMTLLSKYIGIPRSYITMLLFVPLAAELLESLELAKCPSPWKILSIEISAVLNKRNVFITFFEIYFLIDYIVLDQANVWGMSMMVIWLLVTSCEAELSHHNEKLMLKIADTLYLFLIAFCLEQSGSVMHYLLNFYIITYSLLVIRHRCNSYLK